MDKYEKIRKAAAELAEALNERASEGDTFDVMAHGIDVTTYADSGQRLMYSVHVRLTSEKEIC